MDPMGTNDSILKRIAITDSHLIYESYGPCGLENVLFLFFSINILLLLFFAI